MKMKFISMILALLGLTIMFKISAQEPEFSWSALYGENRFMQSANTLIELPDGGFIIAGNKRVDTALYKDQVIVWKIDQEGTQLWSRTYGGEGYTQGSSMVQTPDGGFIITGSIHFGSGAEADIWVLKINADGDSLWSYQYGGASTDAAYCIKPTSDNAYIITGFNSIPASELGDQLYLLKIDADGQEIWSKTYGDKYQNHGFSVQETLDGGFIVTGESYRSYSGNADIWILKTDYKGDTLWTRMYGMEKDDVGKVIVENPADESCLIIAHVTQVVIENEKTHYLFPFQVICLDKNGNLLWSKYYGKDYYNRAYSEYITQDGKLMVGGTSMSSDGSESKIFMWKIDPSTGDSIQKISYTESVPVSGGVFLQTSDFGYLISGKKGRAPAATAYNSYLIRLNWLSATTAIYQERMDINLDLAEAETLDKLLVDISQDEVLGLSVKIGELLHPDAGDLEIILEHEGISVTLVNQPPNSGANFLNTVFFDGASQSIRQASAPYTGIYRPEEPLSAFEGTDPRTEWTLKVIDHGISGGKKSDDRKLNSWGLKLILNDEESYIKNLESAGNSLIQNVFPNPFKGQTSITIKLPAREHVILDVLDIQGRKLLTLVNDIMESGEHQIFWDASGISPGSYIVKLSCDGEREFRKIVLVK
jgi:hypothetical protein